jgi:hypothetical protein
MAYIPLFLGMGIVLLFGQGLAASQQYEQQIADSFQFLGITTHFRKF